MTFIHSQEDPGMNSNRDNEPLRIRNARKRWEARKAATRGKTIVKLGQPQSKEDRPDPVSMVISLCSPTASAASKSTSSFSGKKLEDGSEIVSGEGKKTKEVLAPSISKVNNVSLCHIVPLRMIES